MYNYHKIIDALKAKGLTEVNTNPVTVEAEVRVDNDGFIDFTRQKIQVNRISVKRNRFGTDLLYLNSHNVTYVGDDDIEKIIGAMLEEA